MGIASNHTKKFDTPGNEVSQEWIISLGIVFRCRHENHFAEGHVRTHLFSFFQFFSSARTAAASTGPQRWISLSGA